jgi:GNAT superfamily N-acetyltransferase
MPPGKNMDDWFTIFRSGLWRLYYRLSREGKTRFYSEFLPLLHRTKEEVLQERDDQSLYLVYIGTKPSARGQGYARALIEHGLAMVRNYQTPAQKLQHSIHFYTFLIFSPRRLAKVFDTY